MKMLEAVVRPEKMPVFKERISLLGIADLTISRVSGWIKQIDFHLQWRGQPVAYDLLPKVKFEIMKLDDHVEKVSDAIIDSARTGELRDGVIFVSSVEQAFNVATLEARK
jgi:nitrogen regulatory protein P-II 1